MAYLVITNLMKQGTSTYSCRSQLVVVLNELAPILRDSDIVITYMVTSMLQRAIEIAVPQRHIEQSFTIEAIHSAGISSLFRLHLGLLQATVTAGFTLAALVLSLDSTILL